MDSFSRPSVAIVVPVISLRLTPDEEISVAHLRHYLSSYEVHLLQPEGLEPPPSLQEGLDGARNQQQCFPASCFESVSAYSKLLLSEAFYRRFEAHEFILIYQLDALVFSDDLPRWCAAGHDYLGAPWWRDPQQPELGLSHTGNGGLSLRRVESALRVLTPPPAASRAFKRQPFPLELVSARLPDLKGLPILERQRRRARVLREVRRGVGWYAGHYTVNEDRFWSDRAHLFDSTFTTAPAAEALSFAFEVEPRAAFRLNQERLPFGCHGWARYDRAFWEPFLLDPQERTTMGTATKTEGLPSPSPGKSDWPWEVPSNGELGEVEDGPWPLISIVIPSFNQGEFLEETLRSILLQGYPRLELLVMDGGSTDSTLEVLRRYDPWITAWVSEPDGGQSDAINKGFRRATGELITFFSSDDVYAPGALTEAARCWRSQPGCGAVVGAFRSMDEHSVAVSPVIPPRLPQADAPVAGPPIDLALAQPGTWRLHQVATFFDREALDLVGRHVRPELRYTMDRELLYRISRARRIVITQRLMAYFRRHPASKSVSQVFPFSREMAELHLLDAPADDTPTTQRLRRRYARYWRGRAYLKRARAAGPSWLAVTSLVGALPYLPYLPSLRAYAVQWLEALGLNSSSSRGRT